MHKRHAPLNVTFKITGNCNLFCSHCHSNSDCKGFHIPLQFAKDISAQLASRKVFGVNISGGEPLLHPELFSIVQNLNELGIRVSISTNATLISDEMADKFVSYGITGAHVSLDGSFAELHDHIRNSKGSFDRAVRGIKKLIEKKIPVMLVTVISMQSPEEYERIIDFAYELGVQAHKTNSLIPVGKGKDLSSIIPDKSLGSYIDVFMKKRAQYKGKLSLKGEMGFLMQCNLSEYFDESQPEILNVGCPAGINTCAILENGDVVLCSFAPEIVCGNLKEDSFEAIWNESEIFNNVRKREFGGLCGKCEFLNVCGGCRARAFDNGNLCGTDPLCWKQKA